MNVEPYTVLIQYEYDLGYATFRTYSIAGGLMSERTRSADELGAACRPVVGVKS